MRIWLLCLSALVLVATGCANNAAPEATTAHDPRKTVAATMAATVAVTPTAQPSIQHAPKCTAGDLVVHFRPEGDGGGGHAISLLDLRNVSTSPCVLSGYPRRVTLSEPGHRVVTATKGTFFPVQQARAPIEPGEVTTLGVETDTSCAARPTGGPSGPFYREVRIALPGGVVSVTARRPGLDVGCGAHVTTFTLWR